MTRIKDVECVNGVVTVLYCDGTSKAICGTEPGSEGTVGDYPDSDNYADAPACYIAYEVRQQLYTIMNTIQQGIALVPDNLAGSAIAAAGVTAALGRRAGDYPLLLVPVTFANSGGDTASQISAALVTVEFAEFLQCKAYEAWLAQTPDKIFRDFINTYLVALIETPSSSQGGAAWYNDTVKTYLPLVIGSSIGEFVRWANLAARKLTNGTPIPSPCDFCDGVRPPPPVDNPVTQECTFRYYFSSVAAEPVGIRSLDLKGVRDLLIPNMPSYVTEDAQGRPVNYKTNAFVPNVGYVYDEPTGVGVGLAVLVNLSSAPNGCPLELVTSQITKETSNSYRVLYYVEQAPISGGGWGLFSDQLFPAISQLTIRSIRDELGLSASRILIIHLTGSGVQERYRLQMTRLGVNITVP